MTETITPRRTTRQAISELRRLIAEGDFADQELPAERELAERLSVTRHAVRVALGALAGDGTVTQQGQLWRVGATPRALADGALVVLTDTIRHPDSTPGGHLERIVAGALDTAQTWAIARGAPLLCLPVPVINQATAARVLAERPRGVLVVTTHMDGAALSTAIAPLIASGIPLAAHGLTEDLPDIDSVSSDHAAGAAALVGWLAGRGCRRVLRGWQPDGRAWLANRDRGAREACRHHGMELLPTPPRLPGVLAEEAADAAAFERQVDALAGVLAPVLTGAEPPEAILATSDRHAFRFIAALRRFRLAGPTPLVCGYDNFWRDDPELAAAGGPLDATIDKLNRDTGKAVFALLAERLAGHTGPPRHILLEPRLVVTSESGDAHVL